MPKVSIVMPSLNVAPFIRECIDSVVNQTLKDIEILCVDAGSTDGTLEILQEYAAHDNRISIINSERKSYGYQMNLGFDTAKGEYLGIVETDDYVEPDMFEKLYEVAANNDADLVKSDFNLFSDLPDAGRITLEERLGIAVSSARHISYIDYIKQTIPFDTFMWNGIYKRSFIKMNNIRLNETPGAAYQDAGFRFMVAMLVKDGIFIPSAFYHYRRDNANSSMYSPKGLQYDLQESQYIIEWIMKKFPEDKLRIRAVSQQVATIFLNSAEKAMLTENPNRQALIQSFYELLSIQFKNGYIMQEDFSSAIWPELKMFIESRDSFDYYIKMKAESSIDYNRHLLLKLRSCKELIIFGCGKLGKSLYCMLSRNEIYNVACFCDNNSSLYGKYCFNKEIVSPNEAAAAHPDAVFLVANSRNRIDIMHQLADIGVVSDKIYVFKQFPDVFTCTSRVLC